MRNSKNNIFSSSLYFNKVIFLHGGGGDPCNTGVF